MAHITKITVGDKSTINIGDYENRNPLYSISVEVEGKKLTSKAIQTQIDQLKEIIEYNINKDYKAIKYHQDLPPHHRITDGYPHVTNIITPEELKIPNIEWYSITGTALDKTMKYYIDNGVLVHLGDLPDIPEVHAMYCECLEAMKKQLEEFKDKIEFVGHSVKVRNDEHRYCGELDAYGKFDGKYVIFDFKKTKKLSKALLTKYFMQLAAYAKGCEIPCEEIIVLSPFNPPQITNDIEGFFSLFLEKRQQYKEKYNV